MSMTFTILFNGFQNLLHKHPLPLHLRTETVLRRTHIKGVFIKRSRD